MLITYLCAIKLSELGKIDIKYFLRSFIYTVN